MNNKQLTITTLLGLNTKFWMSALVALIINTAEGPVGYSLHSRANPSAHLILTALQRAPNSICSLFLQVVYLRKRNCEQLFVESFVFWTGSAKFPECNVIMWTVWVGVGWGWGLSALSASKGEMLGGRRVIGGRLLKKKKMFWNGIVPWDMQVLSGPRLQHILMSASLGREFRL